MGVLTIVTDNLLEHSKKVGFYIENKAIELGENYDRYKDNTSDRKKYFCEAIVRAPLFFLIHQWLLLAPHSSYWIIGLLCFVLRFGVAVVINGALAFHTGVQIQLFTHLSFDIAMIWLRQINYWSYQDEAHGIRHEKNVYVWSDITEIWWIPALVTVIIQLIYFCYRPGTLCFRNKEQLTPRIYLLPLVLLISDVFSLAGILTSFMSELSYWVHMVSFVLICVFEILLVSVETDTFIDRYRYKKLTEQFQKAKDEQSRRDLRIRLQQIQKRDFKKKKGNNFVGRFPKNWIIRDSLLSFGIPYMVIAFLADLVINQRTVASLFTLDTVLDISATWCTTPVIVLFLSYGLGILSNISEGLSRFFITTEFQIAESFDANIGRFVQVNALILFIEADILSLEHTEKTDAMKMVVFLSGYAIVFQTLDTLEQKLLQAVNSVSSPGILFHLRVGILTGLLVTAPTLTTYIVSRYMDINPWLLFFASGNCLLIFRTVFLIAECILLTLTWFTDNYLDKLEDIIRYTNSAKNLLFLLLNAVQCYCRYICTFFKGWWIFRMSFSIINFVLVLGIVVFVEMDRYRKKNKMGTLLGTLPGVTYRSRSVGKNNKKDEDNIHECAICLSEMTVGKALPCGHAFHTDCLRRWFQVRTVCPFCNTQL